MPYRSLAEFLENLATPDELVRVQTEVDPRFEIPALAAREMSRQGRAILFTHVKGSSLPVAVNVLATPGRIFRALGVATCEEAAKRVQRLLRPEGSTGWLERLTPGGRGRPSPLAPHEVRSGPCQQIVRLGEDVDLGQLPILQATPSEAGRAITAATLMTADPENHGQVAGRFDLQVLGRDRLAVLWAAYDDPAILLAQYGRRQERMPVAVVLGGDPGWWLASAGQIPPGCDCLAWAGLVREKALDVVAGRSVELLVPAEAELVLEGYIDPKETCVEAGPLAGPFGFHGHRRLAPVLHVTAVTHRANPIYWAAMPGLNLPAMTEPESQNSQAPCPTEAAIIEAVMSRVLLPWLKSAIPEIVDCVLPARAGGQVALLAIHKSYPGQARRVASALLGLRRFLGTKMLILVDASVPLDDLSLWQGDLLAQVNPARDIAIVLGPADPNDPASPLGGLGQRIVVDATPKLPEEYGGAVPQRAVAGPQRAVAGPQRAVAGPQRAVAGDEVLARLSQIEAECGLRASEGDSQ